MNTNMKQQIKPKDIVDKFMLSLKNYELYPENHIVTQTSVTDCMEQLVNYLETDETLSLKIHREKIQHDDIIVYKGTVGEENPAYQMYRDGIELLEFHYGISREEFLRFLKILQHHSMSRSKEESDIVTELWEASFSHISYETSDVFWKDEPLIDFSGVRVVDPPKMTALEQTEEQASAVSMSEKIVDFGLFELSKEDLDYTGRIVHAEEQRNFDVDLFDVLLVILKEQNQEDDFAVVLDIITESLQHTLERAEFKSVVRFFKELKKLHKAYKKEKIWAIPYIDDFMLIISSNKVLASLHKAWPNIDVNDQSQLDDMRKALTGFSPQAIHSLCPIILQVPSSRIQRQLIASVQGLAEKDVRPLIKLLSHPDERVVQNVIFILGFIPGEEASIALLKKLDTSSGVLRIEVVKSLVKRKPVLTKILFALVEDPEPAIRKCVIDRLGKERNTLAETNFINSINYRKFTKGERGFLIQLYRALGGCGSADSIPFLQKQGFRRVWFRNTIRSVHREGAVLALGLLNLPEAEQILSRLLKKKIKKESKQ